MDKPKPTKWQLMPEKKRLHIEDNIADQVSAKIGRLRPSFGKIQCPICNRSGVLFGIDWQGMITVECTLPGCLKFERHRPEEEVKIILPFGG